MATIEQLLKAKIPCEETGIEVKRSLCDICTPGMHCGLNVYVKDGTILKVEGVENYPGSNGKICTKGACTRQYVYRKNRIRTPLRRIGARGEGKFEEISWEEAYREIAGRLNEIKAQDGPEAVAWFTGYSKWYRPWLHRLVHSFGSLNYGTESSCCNTATGMAWKTIAGRGFRGDFANANLLIGWGCNTLIGNHVVARAHLALKKRGGKVIIIDPRITPTTQKLADIHLQIRPGTDGALALGMGNTLIQNGWIDQPFIDKYVHGFAEYKAYVSQFTPERTQEITGVDKDLIIKAAHLYATSGPVAGYFPSAAVTHHINGYNNMRAIMSLEVLIGNVDRKGGVVPVYPSLVYADGGFPTMERAFLNDVKPQNCRSPIGSGSFPLWYALTDEYQAMTLAGQIREQKPYPIRALGAFGMNHRMFPQPTEMLGALEKLDFIFATDLIMTETCRYADIVLPACSSLERSELKVYGGGYLTCTTPATPPLYQSKPDTQIICELAGYLDIEDDLLKSGYEKTMEYLISNLSVTLEELQAAPLPLKMKEAAPCKPGSLREKGFETPTGKLELYSEKIMQVRGNHTELDPLPVWNESFDSADREEYPFTLIAGARLPQAIHTRTHELPWAKNMRPDPTADIHPQDAKALGLQEGDWMQIIGEKGSVTVKVHLSGAGLPGDVYMYHGYAQADINELIGKAHLDPYSGFPGYRQVRCKLVKGEGAK
ncbi:molybdopterin-dependent oxidoreductase [Anaerotruncus rubiinfantis]|uniref:molybdopterin-dependent oxidoreductase n=1 Tax=Anaerotruncus rubiinfantis TaxID=1720200 RepID=UPI0034A2E874